MENASLPVYTEQNEYLTTTAGMKQTQVSPQGICNDETTLTSGEYYHKKIKHYMALMRKKLFCCLCFIWLWSAVPKKTLILTCKTARCVSVVIVKLFAPVVYVPTPSANNPIAFNGNKKKPCGNAAISRWLGAYATACQRTWGHAAKSLLKGSLSKGAYLNVLVFLCSSTFRHMYTEAGARSHTSFFVCICLAVFIVLSLLRARCLLSPFHHCLNPLLPCSPTFLLHSHNRVVIF